MKYARGQAFLDDPNKRILLMGLSGVGKTTACRMMPSQEWFHYSVDYRLWSHQLRTQLNDYLKQLALKEPTLRDLLHKDAISLRHKVHFDNLFATSVYMGMLGSAKTGGSSLADFKQRMQEYAGGEVAAMRDIPYFITRAKRLYNYINFVADASGSLCEIVELDNPHDPVLQSIEESCLPVYIEATDEHIQELLVRASVDPKPIYYRPDFIDSQLPELLGHFGAKSVDQISSKEVGAYLFPKLIAHRIPRYQKIASRIGYTISMTDLLRITSPDELLQLIARSIDNS